MLKKIFLGLIVVFAVSQLTWGQTKGEIDNMRSDTLDVLNYNIKLDFTAMSAKTLSAACKITFKSKMDNVQGISLDLLGLTVDSVLSAGLHLNYTHNDTLLRVNFNSALQTDDQSQITVFYKGIPKKDASNFGGFYFEDGYAYNIGVGFEAEPHNYGRVWHPCFDNFVERASYELEITAPQGNSSYAGGEMISETTGPNNENIRVWKIEEEIPSYLASLSVAPYTHVSQTYTSGLTNTEIPVVLAALPQDTSSLKPSFIHLFDAMDAYEIGYGPYRWNKIGYALVPFNGGAMEHATCIMYPTFAASGSLQWETLMAHELSHHWWGNLVTCRTAEDMWINEGLAAYSESLFLEHLYGTEAYINNLKKTHRDVIQNAHYSDGGFLSLSGVTHDVTYGMHTYDKGAVQMHNLRSHLGDNDFFLGLQTIQNDFAYKDIDALEFRDAFSQAIGKSTDEFFKAYILNPGFNGFEIDSFLVQPQMGTYEVEVFIEQKTFEAPELFNEVPLQITFVDADWNEFSVIEVIAGQNQSVLANVPFHPVMVYLNKDYGLLNAVTGENLHITEATSMPVNYAYFHLNVTAEDDSSMVRIEHLRISPDSFVDQDLQETFVISPDRYWKIDGIWSDSFKANGRIFYDARKNASGNLDNGLMIDHNGDSFIEDSLVLLWRPNQGEEWSVFPDFELTTFSNKTDGYGRIEFQDLKRGEYTLAYRSKSTAGLQGENLKKEFKVYPNPTKDILHIELGENSGIQKINITDTSGKKMDTISIDKQQIAISLQNYPRGAYILSFLEENNLVAKQKFIKE